MAAKTFEIPEIGSVTVTKRSGSRSIRLSIGAKGEVKVSIPFYTPYQSGLDFVRSKAEWIIKHQPARGTPYGPGQRIGKAHTLRFLVAAVDAPAARTVGSEIRISRPAGMAITHPSVQKVAERAGIRALRSQAESLLPQRLRALADKHGFTYATVQVKQLKGRWGSCDTHKNIVLNLFLMQLSWDLIDYVLIHELAHTRHLNHGAAFWAECLRCEPDARMLRTIIRKYQPVLTPVLPPTAAAADNSRPAVA